MDPIATYMEHMEEVLEAERSGVPVYRLKKKPHHLLLFPYDYFPHLSKTKDGVCIIISHDCTIAWGKDGKCHRDEKLGPAIIEADGKESWLKEGRYHHNNGPAITKADGGERWFIEGKLHRYDSPVVTNPKGPESWYYHGVKQYMKTEKEPYIIICNPATSVTEKWQSAMNQLNKEMMDKYKDNVIYKDTDSVFMTMDEYEKNVVYKDTECCLTIDECHSFGPTSESPITGHR